MSKDWTGDKNSVFKMLGASNHTYKEREPNDYYATDPYAIDLLLRDGKAKLNKDIWECACGAGHLSERLKMYGYNMRSTDLINRGYGVGGIDFLKITEKWHGDILTNPPYKYADEFIEHALKLIPSGSKVFVFLKLQFLEGKHRRKLFEKCPPKTIYVSSSRIVCAKNGDFEKMKHVGSAVAYAWYEFVKDYHGDTIVKWIN